MYDKYISIAPYTYSLCNPIIAKDINGKDAKVTIEGNTVKVDVIIYYSMEEGKDPSLNLQQESKLLDYISEASANWNEAGKNVEYKGETYNVEFNIQAIEVETESGVKATQKFSEIYESGQNVAVSNSNEKVIGVNTNTFFLPNFNKVSTFGNTGSHEIGHLIGLVHPEDIYDPNTVMSHNPNRPSPTSNDIKNFLGLLNMDKKVQTVKGANAANDVR